MGETVHLVLRRLFGLFYQPQIIDDDDDCAANGKIKIGRRNRSSRRKPAPLPLCPPQILYDLTRARTLGTATNRLSYGTAVKRSTDSNVPKQTWAIDSRGIGKESEFQFRRDL
jgi:hypothetical protein